MTVREQAPAKVNLILRVGPRRADGLHELCSLFASLELADELTIEPAAALADEVVCRGVEGPNLASAALATYRTRAPLPPLRVTIEKHIPVAAGLGGGSADAAATLRAANAVGGKALTTEELHALAAQLGADVPSQITPRHALVTGAGEGVEPVDLPDMALVLMPTAHGLSTADVYAEADRLPSTRAGLDPATLRQLAAAPLGTLARAMENDLEAAALSLRPELATTLADLEEAGAITARISGSGPTAFGVFATEIEAQTAAATLPGEAIVTRLRRYRRAEPQQ